MAEIPNSIYLYWTGSTVPANVQLNVNMFKKINKNFTVTLVTDDAIIHKCRAEFPELAMLFKLITIPTCKSDIIRLLLLYYYGGIYVDCATTPHASFDTFYQQHKHIDFIISFNYNNSDFSTRILFSKPKILLLKRVLTKIQQNLLDLYNKEKVTNRKVPYNILVLTGTYPFYEILGRNNENKFNITYFDDNSTTVKHYGCHLSHHTNINLHWSKLQDTQKLFSLQ
jgi:mannosyltransferase OCH1-like enzyme